MLSIAVLFASNRNGGKKKEEEEGITDTLVSAKTKISLKALLRRGLLLTDMFIFDHPSFSLKSEQARDKL